MFEDLKARRVGRSAKESARLWASISAAVVFGAIAYGAKGCASDPKPVVAPVAADVKGSTRTLDRKLLEHLEKSPADPAAFDAAGLDYLISEIARGDLRRAPDDVLPLEDVAALDAKVAVGRLIETSGTAKSIDVEEYRSAVNPNSDSLWGFAVEAKSGARIVVVQAGSTKSPDGGRPRAAHGERIDEGVDVKVRGYFLQRRVGSVGGVKGLEQPTVVLVGRESRLTFPLITSIDAPGEASFATLKDRSVDETRGLDDRAILELLSWAGRRGAKRLADDLHSGALPSTFWGRSQFQTWSRELKEDKDQSLPDPRQVTNASRGKVFETSGYLLAHDHEDWDTVPSNPYGVEERFKYWFISDYYGNVMFLVDSPFPLASFPGVRPPRSPTYQQVKLYGVFAKNYTYAPSGAERRPDTVGELTVPYFVALAIEPNVTYVSAPIWRNPFFLIGLSLAVFVAGFLLIMSRMEKKEAVAAEAQSRKLRKKIVLRGTGGGGGGGGSPPLDASAPITPGGPPT
jgi:hypothetical protein